MQYYVLLCTSILQLLKSCGATLPYAPVLLNTGLMYIGITVLLNYISTVQFHYRTNVIPHYIILYFTISLLWYYCTTVLLHYCTTELMYFCTFVQRYYCTTINCTTVLSLLQYYNTIQNNTIQYYNTALLSLSAKQQYNWTKSDFFSNWQ